VNAKTAAAWRRTNEPLIAEFRASGGHPKRRKWPLLLLTTRRVRSRKPIVTPLNYTTDGDRFVVVGSNGGAARNPAWYTTCARAGGDRRGRR
jgi:hypothetical protein